MINIYELLKDCPIGTKLYCTAFGEVKIDQICTNSIRLSIVYKDGILFSGLIVDMFGQINFNGECVLFPSKEQRDWLKFVAPQELPKPDELCWTMSSIGNWTPRYASGEIDHAGNPLFFDNQNMDGATHTYTWRKWCDFNELPKTK